MTAAADSWPSALYDEERGPTDRVHRPHLDEWDQPDFEVVLIKVSAAQQARSNVQFHKAVAAHNERMKEVRARVRRNTAAKQRRKEQRQRRKNRSRTRSQGDPS